MIRGGLVTLYVRDVAEASRFYIETLGMKLVTETPSSSTLDAGDGFRIELTASGSSEAKSEHAPPIGLATKVPLAEAIAIYENRGVVFDVKRDGAGTRAHFRDPEGHALFLFESAGSAESA